MIYQETERSKLFSSRTRDLSYKKFGEWVVLGSAPPHVDLHTGFRSAQWVCKCSCGAEKIVSAHSLIRGRSTACMNCGRRKELEIGRRYGKWTVLKSLPRRADSKGIMCSFYWCKCDCGKESEVRGSNLLSGNSQACMWCRSRRGLKRGEAAYNLLLGTYKKNAKLAHRAFKLSSKLFRILTKANCYYCGIAPQQVSKAKSTNGDYVYNGIDRIDSSKGYTKDNCVTCCKWCNTMKLDRGKQEFLAQIAKIYDNMVRGK